MQVWEKITPVMFCFTPRLTIILIKKTLEHLHLIMQFKGSSILATIQAAYSAKTLQTLHALASLKAGKWLSAKYWKGRFETLVEKLLNSFFFFFRKIRKYIDNKKNRSILSHFPIAKTPDSNSRSSTTPCNHSAPTMTKSHRNSSLNWPVERSKFFLHVSRLLTDLLRGQS